MWLLGEIKNPMQPLEDLINNLNLPLVFGYYPKQGYVKHHMGIKQNLGHS
jgi:hypothetical protein